MELFLLQHEEAVMEKNSYGVLQASIIGLLLFPIYINDMNTTLKYALVHHCTDDIDLLCYDKNPKRLKKVMKSELKLSYYQIIIIIK